MASIEVAQQLLDGKWMHATKARLACQRREWSAFARAVAPERPLLAGRFDHGRCLTLAEGSLQSPFETKVTLVPLWACSTEDDESDAWVAVNGVVSEGEPLSVLEVGPFVHGEDASPRVDSCWDCVVRRWKASTVVQARGYGPGIDLRLRAGTFGVLDMQIDEVLSMMVRETMPRPRPTRMLPMFANWYEPRVEVSPALDAEIRAMSFTAEDEE